MEITKPFVEYLFTLDPKTKLYLLRFKPTFGFGAFSECVLYRTYSRIKEDGTNENWHDIVIRVTEGIYSIRKDFYIKNRLDWDDGFWQKHAKQFAYNVLHMRVLPPGRG